MAELGDLPELVRQFRLETVINQTQTIHTLLRGQRTLSNRVTWERVTERPLGHGGYGEVWLEERVDDVQDQTPVLRAVKSIYTNASSQRRDYIRELEALAKFSSNSHKASRSLSFPHVGPLNLNTSMCMFVRMITDTRHTLAFSTVRTFLRPILRMVRKPWKTARSNGILRTWRSEQIHQEHGQTHRERDQGYNMAGAGRTESDA